MTDANEGSSVINMCSFCAESCKGKIRPISSKTSIPEHERDVIKIGMRLCQYHYNKHVVNSRPPSAMSEFCKHPKHDLYRQHVKISMKKQNLSGVPVRLIVVLGLREGDKICSYCRKKTDVDSDYINKPEYISPTQRINPLQQNVFTVGGHTYVLRDGMLYSAEEFRRLEAAYQDLLNELSVEAGPSLSNNLKSMSDLLFHRQRKLQLSPEYDPDKFKEILSLKPGLVDFLMNCMKEHSLIEKKLKLMKQIEENLLLSAIFLLVLTISTLVALRPTLVLICQDQVPHPQL
jgi:hypothetical protein